MGTGGKLGGTGHRRRSRRRMDLDGTPFHSYLTNARWNLAMLRPGETPAWLILVQAAGASLGAGLVMLAVACARPKRYGWIVLGAGMVIALHLVPGHKEYRFFYIVIPLWLVVGADVLARARRPMRRVAGASFALLSAAGLMEMLPLHKEVWRCVGTAPGDGSQSRTGDAGRLRHTRHTENALQWCARSLPRRWRLESTKQMVRATTPERMEGWRKRSGEGTSQVVQ